jgi:DNA-binding XRE family transcriptional regulator
MTYGHPTRVRTPADLGAVIRDRRRELNLDQATLAKRIGVSRQWVIEIERGHPRAEFGLALRAVDALKLRLDASVAQSSRRSRTVDIDAIVAKAKTSRP